MKLKRIFIFLSVMVIIGIISISLVIFKYSQDLPDYYFLENYTPESLTRIYSSDGELMHEYGPVNRSFVPIEKIPYMVQKAFITTEDKFFFENSGVDILGFPKVIFWNIRKIFQGSKLRGGSTITQQLVKNLLLTNERSLTRKIKEAILAIRITYYLSKHRILEIYLNEIYLGNNNYGVAQAARDYFDKTLDELTIPEIAMLASLTQAPSKFNPYASYRKATNARNYVLKRFLDEKIITYEEYIVFKNTKIKLPPHKKKKNYTEHLNRYIRASIKSNPQLNKLIKSGASIISTVNIEWQKKAIKALQEGLINYDRKYDHWRGSLKNISLPVELKKEELKNYLLNEKQKHIFEQELTIADYMPEDWEVALIYHEDSQGNYLALTKNKQPITIRKKDIAWKKTPIKQQENMFLENYSQGNIALGHYSQGNMFLENYSQGNIALEHYSQGNMTLGNYPQGNMTLGNYPQGNMTLGNYPQGNMFLENYSQGNIALGHYPQGNIALENHMFMLKSNSQPLNTSFLSIGDTVLVKQVEDSFFSLQQEPAINGAIVVMEPYSGAILSLVGGFQYTKDTLNRAINSNRQIGSIIKPIVYFTALDNNLAPNDTIVDSNIKIIQSTSLPFWEPKNYSKKYFGLTPLRKSIEKSRNVGTIRLVEQIGLETIEKHCEDFTYLKCNSYHSFSLGSTENNLLNMVAAYSPFINYSYVVFPHAVNLISDIRANTLFKYNHFQCLDCDKERSVEAGPPNFKINPTNFISNMQNSSQSLYQTNYLLQGSIKQGTSRSMKGLQLEMGGKTGTTNANRSTWFIGFTPTFIAGAYVGYDGSRNMHKESTGAKTSLPIIKQFTKSIKNDLQNIPFKIPSDIEFKWVRKDDGEENNNDRKNDVLLEAIKVK